MGGREEVIRRHFRYNREFVEGGTTHTTLERMERIMEKVGVTPLDRLVVLPAREAAEDARKRSAMGKGYNGVYSGAAIEIAHDSGKAIVVQGKNSPLLHAEAAALLNGAKALTGLSDELKVISRAVIDSVREMKKAMGLTNLSLNVREVLDALAASAVLDAHAKQCMNSLVMLRGCEMHSTHLMEPGDETPLKQLGLEITTDAKLHFLNNNYRNAP